MLLSYIKNNWDKTVRDKSTPRGFVLPYPFTVPCSEERFTCFFYWDTYFTNLGLLYDDIEQAKHNINNMKFFVDKLGYIPNGNERVMFNRSQPPLYAHAVMDYYQKTKDVGFVSMHYPTIQKEYSFWMTNRITAIGLNQYNATPTNKEINDFRQDLSARGILFLTDNSTEEVLHYFAEAESGWDFSPRYNGKALDFVQVDLNAILYKTEIILSKLAKILEKKEDEKFFLDAAAIRKMLIERYCCDEKGLFHDYNFKTEKQSNLITVASILPFAFGISEDRNACLATLKGLEFEFGVAAGELKTGFQGFQWAYPNMWPPLIYWVYQALVRLDLQDDAKRICNKYIKTVDENFKKTSRLWEKYDVTTGQISNIEYESPSMLGWTAGVYVFLKNNEKARENI